MTTFDSLEQRMAHTYLDTFPAFVPADRGCDPGAQEAFYRLMHRLYSAAFKTPKLFVGTLHEDDAYPNRFNSAAYGKPKLKAHMRKFTQEVDALLQTMLDLGQGREGAKVSRKHLAVLKRLGVDPQGPLPEGWVFLATRPAVSLLTFSRCMFHVGHPYVSDIFARLLCEAPFRRLEAWLADNGYTRYALLDGRLSLTYANLAWDSEPPRAGFEYKIRHTGISVHYQETVRTPQVLGLCIPKGLLRRCLDAFEAMPPTEQAFVAGRTKPCDACGYCVQTDKTGKRPLACVLVHYRGQPLKLCPYFPGYRYCWTQLDDALVDGITGMLAFMDRLREAA